MKNARVPGRQGGKGRTSKRGGHKTTFEYGEREGYRKMEEESFRNKGEIRRETMMKGSSSEPLHVKSMVNWREGTGGEPEKQVL